MHTLRLFLLLRLVLAVDGEFRPVVLFILRYNRLLCSYLVSSPPCCELCVSRNILVSNRPPRFVWM